MFQQYCYTQGTELLHVLDNLKVKLQVLQNISNAQRIGEFNFIVQVSKMTKICFPDGGPKLKYLMIQVIFRQISINQNSTALLMLLMLMINVLEDQLLVLSSLSLVVLSSIGPKLNLLLLLVVLKLNSLLLLMLQRMPDICVKFSCNQVMINPIPLPSIVIMKLLFGLSMIIGCLQIASDILKFVGLQYKIGLKTRKLF